MYKLVVNCETKEESYIPLSQQEINDLEQEGIKLTAKIESLRLAAEAEQAARESARAKLAALGLTEAEVAALVK